MVFEKFYNIRNYYLRFRVSCRFLQFVPKSAVVNTPKMIPIRWILPLAFLILSVTAATSQLPPPITDVQELANPPKWSFYDIATFSTAVLVVSAGFAALMSLFLPLFIFKLCYFFGICQDTLDIFNQFVVPRKVHKRSVEYLEPMMTTLVNAYEKYADIDLKKKSKKHRV